MTSLAPVVSAAPGSPALGLGPAASPARPQRDFATLLSTGVAHVESKLATAESLAARFAVDDSVPIHQVTNALEEARLSVELMMQVRGRLVDAYQDVMRMQL